MVRAVMVLMAIATSVLPAATMAQGKAPERPIPAAGWELRTGTDYLSACGTALDPNAPRFQLGVCGGYVRGLAAGLESTQALYVEAMHQPKVSCLPKTYAPSQLMRVGLKYLNDHPADLHRPLEDLMVFSWIQSFPCP
jgi:hypothetical protein